MNDLRKIILIALLLAAFFFKEWTQIFLIIALIGLLLFRIIPEVFSAISKEQNPEDDFDDSVNDENEWRSDFSEKLNLIEEVLGYPTDEQFSVLISLFRLRYSIILKHYHAIRNFQVEVKDEHWIKLFLKKYAGCPSEPYQEFNQSELQELNQKAENVFNLDFNNHFSAPTDLYKEQVQKILIALHYWVFSPQDMIKILDSISTFGFYNKKLNKLIEEYVEIEKLTSSGRFEKIFIPKEIDNLKCKNSLFKVKSEIDRARDALQRTLKIWNQILEIFKISIIQRNIKEKNSYNEELLEQLSALKHMERHIDSAILQAGKESNSLGGGIPYREKEKFFFSHAETNPFLNNYGWQV